MKKIYYEKQGRRYVPVSEYDSEVHDSFPHGHHLVSVWEGRTSRRFQIDPDLAPMIAAGLYAEEGIVRAIYQASELRPAKKLLTDEQITAWKTLQEALGEEATTLTSVSAFDVAQAGIQAMREEADKMMQNEAVRKAYEHFLLMCKLTKERENVNS